MNSQSKLKTSHSNSVLHEQFDKMKSIPIQMIYVRFFFLDILTEKQYKNDLKLPY